MYGWGHSPNAWLGVAAPAAPASETGVRPWGAAGAVAAGGVVFLQGGHSPSAAGAAVWPCGPGVCLPEKPEIYFFFFFNMKSSGFLTLAVFRCSKARACTGTCLRLGRGPRGLWNRGRRGRGGGLRALLRRAALILTSFQAEVTGFTGALRADAPSSRDPAAHWGMLYCHHVRFEASRQAGGVSCSLDFLSLPHSPRDPRSSKPVSPKGHSPRTGPALRGCCRCVPGTGG